MLLALGLSLVPVHSALALPGATAPAIRAGQVASTTSTTSTTPTTLAGTTLQAERRDEGTALAPWLIWSGVVAGASVLVGGLLLKRRMT